MFLKTKQFFIAFALTLFCHFIRVNVLHTVSTYSPVLSVITEQFVLCVSDRLWLPNIFMSVYVSYNREMHIMDLLIVVFNDEKWTIRRAVYIRSNLKWPTQSGNQRIEIYSSWCKNHRHTLVGIETEKKIARRSKHKRVPTWEWEGRKTYTVFSLNCAFSHQNAMKRDNRSCVVFSSFLIIAFVSDHLHNIPDEPSGTWKKWLSANNIVYSWKLWYLS